MTTFSHSTHRSINKLSTENSQAVGKNRIFRYIVDNTMLNNYYTLAALATSLDNRLRGKQIREIYSQEKGELVVAFAEESPALVVSCNPSAICCYLHPAAARARRNSADLFPDAQGTSIDGVSIHPSDRVITFHLRNGFSLIAQMFGPQANALLIDSSGTITYAFKQSRELAGSRLERREAELIHDLPLLRSMLQEEKGSTVSAILKRVFPTFGALLVHEVIIRSALDPLTAARALTRANIESVCSHALAILAELASPLPRVYLSPEGIPHTFSIVGLQSMANLTEKTFVDIHEAVRFFLSRRRASSGIDKTKSTIIGTIERILDKDRRTVEALKEAQRAGSRADEYESHGKLLLANLHSFRKGDRAVAIPGEHDLTTITVDEKLSPVQNAQRYFDKAKRSRQASMVGTERLAGIQKRMALGDRLIAEISPVHDQESVRVFMNDHKDELAEFGLGSKGEVEHHVPFRIFTVDGGFEVWAGKNSSNNDLLTLKHSKPNDLWFHARGSGGSHVVLKVGTGKGEPGKKAREQAAAIAAYYSKMKNAKVVPVAMTEKKYVRKPKGAPAGTVVLEREKVIFAEPALPGKEPD